MPSRLRTARSRMQMQKVYHVLHTCLVSSFSILAWLAQGRGACFLCGASDAPKPMRQNFLF